MPKRGNGKAPALLTLSTTDIQTLRFIARVRFATAQQVAEAIGSRGALTTWRERLRRLSGGDKMPRFPLYRFRYPSPHQGNSIRVYCVSSRGRALLREAGIHTPASFYRPHKVQMVTHGFLRHALLLSSVCAVSWRWQGAQDVLSIRTCKLSYELARMPKLKVVPDAWMQVSGKGGSFGLWIEVDTGSEFSKQWSAYFRRRLRFIHSGEYKKFFQTSVSRIAYVCVGERRRKTLCRLAMAVLKDLGKENLASSLRFASVTLDTVYELGLFDRPVWRTPAQPATPIPLFPSSSQSTEEH